MGGGDGRAKPRPGVEAQRRAIATAAVRLFAERPPSTVSVRELCREADVSRPTFYRCFDDHDALLAWLYEESVERWVETIFLAELPGGLVPGWLDQAVGRLVDATFAEPELSRFVLQEASRPASPVRAVMDRSLDRTARRLQRGLGQRAGSLRFLRSVFAGVQWILLDALRGPDTPARRAAAREAVLELTTRTLAPREVSTDG